MILTKNGREISRPLTTSQALVDAFRQAGTYKLYGSRLLAEIEVDDDRVSMYMLRSGVVGGFEALQRERAGQAPPAQPDRIKLAVARVVAGWKFLGMAEHAEEVEGHPAAELAAGIRDLQSASVPYETCGECGRAFTLDSH